MIFNSLEEAQLFQKIRDEAMCYPMTTIYGEWLTASEITKTGNKYFVNSFKDYLSLNNIFTLISYDNENENEIIEIYDLDEDDSLPPHEIVRIQNESEEQNG